MLDHNWILQYRTEWLTKLFLFFPFLASDYFYILTIALGFWLRPDRDEYRALGFLVPFGTIINCILKNLFRITRPEISLHITPLAGTYGFPSGDVQVATIFWLILFLYSKNKLLKYFLWIPIIGIACSRVYLGVHSIYDVLGGIFFGVLIVCLWQFYLAKYALNNKKLTLALFAFWLFVLIIIYCLVSINLEWSLLVSVSLGALIGFALSFSQLCNNLLCNQYQMSLTFSPISLSILVILYKIIPYYQINDWMFHLSLIFKFATIIFAIYIIIPNVIFKIDKLFSKNRK